MPRAYPLKVGRLVTYITAGGKRRPGKVVGGIVSTTCNVKTYDGVTQNGVTVIPVGSAKPYSPGWRRA